MSRAIVEEYSRFHCYVHLQRVQYTVLSASSLSEGPQSCGLGAMSGARAEDICRCSYCCMRCLTDTWLGPDRLNTTIATREISTCCQAGSGLFTTLGCAHAHASTMDDTCTKLARGPWGTGGVWRAMTVRPKGITRNNEERSWVIGDPDLRGTYARVWCFRWGRYRLGNLQIERLRTNTQYLVGELNRLGDLYKTLKNRGNCSHIQNSQREILNLIPYVWSQLLYSSASFHKFTYTHMFRFNKQTQHRPCLLVNVTSLLISKSYVTSTLIFGRSPQSCKYIF